MLLIKALSELSTREHRFKIMQIRVALENWPFVKLSRVRYFTLPNKAKTGFVSLKHVTYTQPIWVDLTV